MTLLCISSDFEKQSVTPVEQQAVLAGQLRHIGTGLKRLFSRGI